MIKEMQKQYYFQIKEEAETYKEAPSNASATQTKAKEAEVEETYEETIKRICNTN